jgi:hypothetical protein
MLFILSKFRCPRLACIPHQPAGRTKNGRSSMHIAEPLDSLLTMAHRVDVKLQFCALRIWNTDDERDVNLILWAVGSNHLYLSHLGFAVSMFFYGIIYHDKTKITFM